jgi:ribosomal protein S18 acetylase RimI-like enzyme
MQVYVAELDGAVAGFVFTLFDAKRKTGEIGLNAVDPRLQSQGIGKAMYEFALLDLKVRGAEIDMSEPAGTLQISRREAPTKAVRDFSQMNL